MSRTFDADHILAALIEAYQQDEHFCFQEDGKVFARIIVTADEASPIPVRAKADFCLTDMANKLAERLSR